MGKLHKNSRAILKTGLYSVIAGVVVVGFQQLITYFFDATFKRLAEQSHADFLLGTFAVMVLSAMAVGILVDRFSRESAGSGIPQVKAAFWKDFGLIPRRAIWMKFLAGILSIGGGNSLGREGPSIQIASGVSSMLAGVAGEPKHRRRRATAAGAAVGLAAAFNTPIAAVAFVLEGIIQDLSSNLLGGVLLAAVIGALLVQSSVGSEPAFSVAHIGVPTWRAYALTPVVAALASLAGVLFQKLTLSLRYRQIQATRIPHWLKPAVGSTLAWGIGAAAFLFTGHLGVFGLGYGDLTAGMNHHLTWQIAGVLLAAKLAATVLCYGFGGCGGIFSPTMFFGGMMGLLVAGITGWVMPLSANDSLVLGVVGMGACMSAVVRAPVTGVLMMFEMTGEFTLLPALMIGALVSQAIGRGLIRENFFDAILEQDGHKIEKLVPPQNLRNWQWLPVSTIANFHPVVLNSLTPAEIEGCLNAHPFAHFPVMREGKPAGIAVRTELVQALQQERSPELLPVVSCEPRQRIHELQGRLMESPSSMVLVCNGSKLLGLVTLHDLLRAQINAAQESL